ncbi:MAG: glycosyltransferase family 4 protein [Phocaeicola sp.]
MMETIVYILGGNNGPNGMSQVLSQKINYLAENTHYKIVVILTETPLGQPYYPLSDKILSVNFDLNFDELDTMPLLKKLYFYFKKQRLYKRKLLRFLVDLQPTITISACRREMNFINSISDGSKKIGEIHFNKSNYRQINKPYLPAFMNKYFSRLWINQFIKEVKKLDRFVVLSEEDKLEWPELSNIQVIYNPLKKLPNDYSKVDTKRVIAAGRYTWQKGFDLLCKAWMEVHAKHPDWNLDIYGEGNYAPLQSQAAKEGLGDSFRCHRAVSDIYTEYLKSSIFVLSSRYEGFGLVLAEAMSCGVPVVSFVCPCGPKDIVTHGRDGFLAKREDSSDLAKYICLLIENRELRETFGKQATDSSARFDEKIIMQQWVELFRDMAD